MGDLRQRLYALVETGHQGYPAGRAFDIALVAIIVVNIAATAMATVPDIGQAWHAAYPTVEGGGVLATGGNLVFQGRADGILAAYRATDGKQQWTFDAGTGIIAPPVTYLVNGVQTFPEGSLSLLNQRRKGGFNRERAEPAFLLSDLSPSELDQGVKVSAKRSEPFGVLS